MEFTLCTYRLVKPPSYNVILKHTHHSPKTLYQLAVLVCLLLRPLPQPWTMVQLSFGHIYQWWKLFTLNIGEMVSGNNQELSQLSLMNTILLCGTKSTKRM